MTRRLSAAKAREIIETAEIVKSPTWSEDRRWHVVADGKILVVIEPSYSGTGRNGWTWWLHDIGRMRATPQSTREKAAIAGLEQWERWVTSTRA